MSNEVTNGWQTLAFSEAVIVNPKRSLPKCGVVPFLDMASLPLHGAPVHIVDSRPVASGGSKFQKGDTLFARITPCAENGKLGFVSDINGGPVAQGSTEFIVMGPRDGVTLPEYVRWLSGWDYVRSQAIGLMEGTSGRQRIPTWAFEEIEVVVPPLDEQRRIAEVLRSVDEAIAANRAALNQMVCVRAATLRMAFEETDWEPVKLGELGRWQSGGTPSKADASLWNGNVPWVCPRDMKSPVVRRTKSSVSSKAVGGPCKLAPRGSLLIVVRGMILAKAIPSATIAMDATFNQDVKAFISNGRALPKYVQLCLQHQEQALLRMVNTATHGTKKLDADTLANIDVPLPDLATQEELAKAVADMDLAMARYGEEHVRLATLKDAVQADLLSGRVRVPPPAATTTKSVPPAFKRAVFAAEIVHQLHNDNRFGSVKHEKIVHLCELHLGLQNDLDRHAYKEAAGPYDPKARRSVERIFQQQKWFDVTKPDGSRVVYLPLEKAGGHAEYFDRYFGEQKGAIQSIIDLLRPLNTEQCEIVATLYAVWNDFLIDKRQPDDDEIVASVLQWHPKKQQITGDRWLAALPWLRQKGLIPKGTGEKTRVAQA